MTAAGILLTGLGRVTGQVLIVGGGVAGLSLARALRQRGIEFVVVDRHDASRDAGLGLNLPGNAIQALCRLDLGDDISLRGRPIRRREYRNAKGRLLFAVDEAAFWGNAVTSRCVRRGDLLDLLRAGAGPESIRWNSTIVNVEPNAGHVEVRSMMTVQRHMTSWSVPMASSQPCDRPCSAAAIPVRRC